MLRFLSALTALTLLHFVSSSHAAEPKRVEFTRLVAEHGLLEYNRDNKVAPMERALAELDVGTWFAGLRRDQSNTRTATPFVTKSGDRHKVHPIADWTDRDVHRYLLRHELPYHPLREQGYISIGDVNTTKPITDVSSAEETRFFGMRRECGLHEMDFGAPQIQAD